MRGTLKLSEQLDQKPGGGACQNIQGTEGSSSQLEHGRQQGHEVLDMRQIVEGAPAGAMGCFWACVESPSPATAEEEGDLELREELRAQEVIPCLQGHSRLKP